MYIGNENVHILPDAWIVSKSKSNVIWRWLFDAPKSSVRTKSFLDYSTLTLSVKHSACCRPVIHRRMVFSRCELVHCSIMNTKHALIPNEPVRCENNGMLLHVLAICYSNETNCLWSVLLFAGFSCRIICAACLHLNSYEKHNSKNNKMCKWN